MTELEQAVTAIMDALRKEGVWMDEESYGDISHAVRKEIAGLMPEESESFCPACGFPICESNPTKFENQIAKRKIEEYINETLKDSDPKCPVAREFRAIFQGFLDWLDKGGE